MSTQTISTEDLAWLTITSVNDGGNWLPLPPKNSTMFPEQEELPPFLLNTKNRNCCVIL